jgi:hypothetical protein
MTPELAEAVEKVARALCLTQCSTPDMSLTAPDYTPAWTLHVDQALAAIRAVAEITREASETMRRAYDKAPTDWTADYCARDWRAMHAASILGEALNHGE